VSIYAGGTGLYDGLLWRSGSSGCCIISANGGSLGNGYLYLSTVTIGGSSSNTYLYRYAPSGTSTSLVQAISLRHYDNGLPSGVVPYFTSSTLTQQPSIPTEQICFSSVGIVQPCTIKRHQLRRNLDSNILWHNNWQILRSVGLSVRFIPSSFHESLACSWKLCGNDNCHKRITLPHINSHR